MSEQMNRNSNNGNFRKNQGFYIVLVICLVAVGAAVAIMALAKPATPNVENPPTVQTNLSGDQSASDILMARATAAPTAKPVPTPTIAPLTATTAPSAVALVTATPKAASATSKAAPPVSGGIIWGYAVDKLIYSKTLDAWVTHDGVDIAADLGATVKCVFAGTVEKAYQDDALGYTVVVRHTNNRSTLYANLEEGFMVKEGDKVNAGDVIGKVGTSAISECADAPHLHFAMFIDGKSVNPASHVRLG